MGFYGMEPFSKATAYYVWMGLNNEPGAFTVEVEGCAPNFTSGIQLVRDSEWFGGLKIDVMGWTGPVGEGCTDYKVTGSFPGQYLPEIVVCGSNGQRLVPVEQIPYEDAENFLRERVGQTA